MLYHFQLPVRIHYDVRIVAIQICLCAKGRLLGRHDEGCPYGPYDTSASWLFCKDSYWSANGEFHLRTTAAVFIEKRHLWKIDEEVTA